MRVLVLFKAKVSRPIGSCYPAVRPYFLGSNTHSRRRPFSLCSLQRLRSHASHQYCVNKVTNLRMFILIFGKIKLECKIY
jgi:hypothetical protein